MVIVIGLLHLLRVSVRRRSQLIFGFPRITGNWLKVPRLLWDGQGLIVVSKDESSSKDAVHAPAAPAQGVSSTMKTGT